MNLALAKDFVQNYTYDEIEIGQSARLLRTLTVTDIKAFAAVSGDTNPAHLDPAYASDTLFHVVIAHGMWSGALISALLGTQFPGPGTIYLDQELHFSRPVHIGDTLTVTVTVTAKDDAKKTVEFNCEVVNQKGARVLHGIARVLAPTKSVRVQRINAPQIQLFDPEARFSALLALAKDMAPVRCAVAHPCDAGSLRGAMEAARHGLIVPVLIGPDERIRRVAEAAGIVLAGAELVAVPHSHAAAQRAANMAAEGDVEMVMKGSLPNDELLRAILEQRSLRTGRRMSHVFRFDIPLYPKPLVITDAGINIRPTLLEKVDIIQNAIDFTRITGIDTAKVAILAAVETLNTNIPSTLDAAILCKMVDRGQIHGGILDGPLAFDNAISLHAAQVKDIDSPVAGDADIMVVPDLESGTMLAKQLETLAGATGAGIVVGAKVPIAMTNQEDGPTSAVASALLARLVAHNSRRDHPRERW